MAKPIRLPLWLFTMAVFTPTTSPERSNTGPPEFPGLIAASVCKNSSYGPEPQVARGGAEVSERDAGGEPEGATDGKEPVADVQPGRVPEVGGREVRRRRAEPDQREVGRGVASHEVGVEAAAVRQAHLDGAPALDDVVVGHHQARAVDDEPRAPAFLLRWMRGAEEALVPRRHLRGPNHRQAHHARADALDQRREGRQRNLRAR